MGSRTVILILLGVCAAARSDTVGVICPNELHDALEPWVDFRRAQGHTIHVNDSPAGIARLLAPALKNQDRVAVLLVGEGRADAAPSLRAPARVIWRYGPERSIPTDAPYGDFDVDGAADATVSRLPFSNKADLSTYVTRLLAHEQRPTRSSDLRLQILAGEAGFSPLIDAAIEATATRLLGALAPDEAILSLRRVPGPAQPTATGARGGVGVWLGHGLRDQLPGVRSENLVSVFGGADVALLLACYAGDCAAPGRCVAEQLLAADNGPLAVIASTGVSMPYGNARLGAELLLAANRTTSAPWSRMLQHAKLASLEDASSPDLKAIDTLAQLMSGSRDQLLNERADHTALYQHFGDPLLAPRRPLGLPTTLAQEEGRLVVRGRTPIAGRLTIELSGAGRLSEPVATATRPLAAGEDFVVRLTPTVRSGSARVRVTVDGPHGLARSVVAGRVAMTRPLQAAEQPVAAEGPLPTGSTTVSAGAAL